jgi:hypothetical protein
VAGDFPIEQVACQARPIDVAFNALIVKEFIIRQFSVDRIAGCAADKAFGYPNAARVLCRRINSIH